VVRQYVPAGRYQGAQDLSFVPIAPTPGHPQHVNLIVTETATGAPLQALSVSCAKAAVS